MCVCTFCGIGLNFSIKIDKIIIKCFVYNKHDINFYQYLITYYSDFKISINDKNCHLPVIFFVGRSSSSLYSLDNDCKKCARRMKINVALDNRQHLHMKQLKNVF
jgi:hypothetical protein